MIMAKWRTGAFDSEVESLSATGCDCVFSFLSEEKSPCSLAKLDLQNLQFLGFADLVHLVDEAIGELLQAVGAALQLVLGNFFLFLTIAQLVMGITTKFANPHLVVIQFLMDVLDHIPAAIFAHWRDRETNNLSIVAGVNTQVRLLNSLLDLHQHLAVPRLDDQQTRIRYRNCCNLADRRRCTIVLDGDAIDQRGTGAASTNSGQILFQDLNRLLHTTVCIAEKIIYHTSAPFMKALARPSLCDTRPAQCLDTARTSASITRTPLWFFDIMD